MLRKLSLPAVLVSSFAISVSLAGEINSAAVEAATKKATAFLLSTQNENGTFGKSRAAGMPGLVGLVVKALASSPEKINENNPVVAKAVKYILSMQQANGSICAPQIGLENYNTSVALIALAALENPTHREAMEKAQKYILSCQQIEEKGVTKDNTKVYGGFGYGSNKGADLSNTGFSIEALKAAGLKEDSPVWRNAVAFIQRCQDNPETNDLAEAKDGDGTGGFIYFPGTSAYGKYSSKTGKEVPRPYGSMTYTAIKSLISAGIKKDEPALKAAFDWIKRNYNPKIDPGGKNSEGYYYYAICFAKALTAAEVKELDLLDGKKADWAKDLSEYLLSIQKPDGSFVNTERRWMEDDPVLTTAYALDALNLCLKAMKQP